MKRQKWILLLVALALMAGAAGALARIKSFQKLGRPGIVSTPIPGDVKVNIALPENVPGFTSTNVPESEVELGYFPKDTSYAHRIYQAPDGFVVSTTAILMGTDRTSIHKPDYCLTGQGWNILSKRTVKVSIGGATPYELPVSVWVLSRSIQSPDGQTRPVGAIYGYWFVADGEQTPSHPAMMWRLGAHLVRTGVWQRWAYVSYFAPCEPGGEEAALARVGKLIAASVPEFQRPPQTPGATAVAPR